MDYLPDELVLRKLGWTERNPGIWENKLDDYHNVYIAFNKDRRGFAYAFNDDGSEMTTDIVEEMDVVISFRKHQEKMENGIPFDWDLY